MNKNFIRFLLIAGSITILANFAIQVNLLRHAYNEGEKKFSQTVHIALLEVVKKISNNAPDHMPQNNPVRKVSGDYYIVEVNDHINASILEHYLKSELARFGLITDFEYGIYNCYNDEMVYGNYIHMGAEPDPKQTVNYLPKYPALVYYFGIRFPSQSNYIIGSLRLWLILASISLIIIIFFLYAMINVLRQKRFSEMQRDFINNMTHEFKTPITAGKIAIEYIARQKSIKEDEHLEKYCHIIENQLDHLNRQMEKILQVSVSEKKSFPIDKKPVNPEIIIHKVAGVFHTHEQKPVIDQKFPEVQLNVKVDEIHLINVIYSLLDNAIKYSNGQPLITIELSIIRDQICISIKDKGIGIDKKYQKKIFQKFFRVPTGNLYQVKGFGLGLYYVKKISDKHGWKVTIESTPREGTEINILFPKKDCFLNLDNKEDE
jgi:two-component system, OmpR family, phosphate regulon sensor histidine kinase PhoR